MGKIHITQEGDGPPVLFVHGNPDTSDLWRPMISELQDSFRCIAPDLPGFGDSEIPDNFDSSLPAMASFVDQVVQQAGIDKPLSLVVHDFGGPFGLAWAVQNPVKVRHICVMNTNFFSDFKWHFWAKIWRTPILGEISMATMIWPTFRNAMKQGSRLLTDEQIRHTFSRITPRTKRMVLQLYRATNPENFRGWEDRLLQLTAQVPTLVLWGDRDPYISRRFAERYGARKVLHFPDSGHWLPLEKPVESAAHLRTFVDETE